MTAGMAAIYTRFDRLPNPLRRGAYPTDARIIHVDRLAQLPDIFIAIAIKVDEGLDVERQWQGLGHNRSAVVGEVVVAIDQDFAVLIGTDNLAEAFCGEIGERQVDRACYMPLGKSLCRAGVKEQYIGFGRACLEL